ncbi:hypothetical protein PF003_g1822 [Phytophthora fragariae]|nr:hypothetical protein PF003_g1822 [Phytophthora fragariae]
MLLRRASAYAASRFCSAVPSCTSWTSTLTAPSRAILARYESSVDKFPIARSALVFSCSAPLFSSSMRCGTAPSRTISARHASLVARFPSVRAGLWKNGLRLSDCQDCQSQLLIARRSQSAITISKLSPSRCWAYHS